MMREAAMMAMPTMMDQDTTCATHTQHQATGRRQWEEWVIQSKLEGNNLVPVMHRVLQLTCN